jgi:DNA-binding transcriptional LysR family regulator
MVEIAKTGITLRQLQILREVVRTGSERSAAKMLEITQPAVSQQIKQLETMLGVQLFLRDKGRLQPTSQTMMLFRDTDATFVQMERISRTVASLKGIESDTVSIATPHIFCLDLIPRALQRLRPHQPHMIVQIRSGDYHEMVEHILEGRADIALSRLPIDENIFDWVPLVTATNVCVFHAGHRFSQEERITPEEMKGEPLIDVDPQFNSQQMNENALRYMGVEPYLAIQVDVIGQEASFLAAGLGVTITNSFAASQLKAFNLEIRPYEPSSLYHYILFWQKGRRLPALTEAAKDALVACANER